MAAKPPSLSFGIEEEYHLVDLKSRDLAAAPEGLLRKFEKVLGSQASPEFLKSQIEIGTRPETSFAAARNELRRLRAGIVEEAARFGMAPMAAGTHPFGVPGDMSTSDKERYQQLERDMAGAIRGLAACGMHVHAGIEDDDLRIDLMNQVRYFLPHLLMLSTSSPFWRGANTGLKSYRLTVMKRLPRTGLPGLFSSWAEYQATLGVLVRSGVIEDGTKLWWDLRPSARFPTLELRITDVCPRVEDALTIAATYLCVLRMLWRHRTRNLKWRTYPISLIDENRWRAQRYGVKGELLDLSLGQLVPFAELISELQHLIREDAQALGCEAEIAGLTRIVSEGTSADRQERVFDAARKSGANEHEALVAVVDHVVRETAGAD